MSQAAVAAALDGDTVHIPAGECGLEIHAQRYEEHQSDWSGGRADNNYRESYQYHASTEFMISAVEALVLPGRQVRQLAPPHFEWIGSRGESAGIPFG